MREYPTSSTCPHCKAKAVHTESYMGQGILVYACGLTYQVSQRPSVIFDEMFCQAGPIVPCKETMNPDISKVLAARAMFGLEDESIFRLYEQHDFTRT